MPGAGKSTAGVVLAKMTGYHFLDSDIEIQDREGKTLPELIRENGIEGFIEIEGKVNETLGVNHTVIATGGSAVYHERSMMELKKNGKVVYIKLGYESLLSRLGDLKERGVVLKKNQSLKSLYKERHPLYMKYADEVVDGDRKTIQELAFAIKEKLNL